MSRIVLQIFWNGDPEILNIGGISLHYYSILFAIAFLFGYQIISNIYKLVYHRHYLNYYKIYNYVR